MQQRTLAIAFAIGLVTLAAGAGAQNRRDQRGTPAGTTTQSGQPRSDTPAFPRPATRDFVERLSIDGMAEVQLGKLATERAESADVKAFGQMMEKDHTKANDELKQIANQLNLRVPTQLDQSHKDLIDRLSRLRGAEFDREYAKAMVDGHEQVVNLLEDRSGGSRAVGTSGDADRDERGEQALTQWATKTLPIVRGHLDRARELLMQKK